MSTYSAHSTPTPTYVPPSYPLINVGSTINPALMQANSILHTVELSNENYKDWGILDSGASSHFLCLEAPMDDMQVASNPVLVTIPDGTQVRSTHVCKLRLPQVPEKGRFGHVLPGLSRHSLVSVVRLCNAGCEITFSKIECIVKYRGRIVLRGKKCTRTGLWMVPLDQPTTPAYEIPTFNENQDIVSNYAQNIAANVIPTSSPEELAMYFHQCLGSPPKSTLLKALRNKAGKNQLKSFPGLTFDLISKHLPPSSATDKGHMVRTRQGVRSTRSNRQDVIDARLSVDDMNPPEQVCSAFDDEIFCYAVLADENDGTIYSDQTGRFPVRSYSGKNYIFVAYVYSKNAILLRPLSARNDDNMVTTFQELYAYLGERGIKPRLHVLDNECSKAIKSFIRSQDTNIQLVEPHNHRVNAAETAVKAAKYHMIAALATMDVNCPIQLWDRFLPQVQDTLNMLRTSRDNAAISAYEALEGPFDFNKTPISILGTRALAYLDPDERTSWQPHGVDVFYTGRCPLHYRMLEFFNPTTRSYRATGTYRLYPTHCKVPTLSEADRTIIAATDLIENMRSMVPTSAEMKCRHAKAIEQLTEILENRQEPRVGTSQPPRVVGEATTSIDATSPKVIKKTPLVHQRQTRRNTPMPTIMEGDEATRANKDIITQGIKAPAARRARPPPTSQQLIRPTRIQDGEIIGSKRNHYKVATRKHIESLINQQAEKDRQLVEKIRRNQPIDLGLLAPTKSPTTNPTIELFEHPEVIIAGGRMPEPPTSIPESDENISSPQNKLPTVTQDEASHVAANIQRVYCQQSRRPTFVRPEALNFVIGQMMMNAYDHGYDHGLPFNFDIDIEEVCNGVVDPTTKKTLTKYHKVIEVPELRETWMKAMCIELGRIAQGYKDTKGTNTVKFMNLEEIANIPEDRTVTYARIVVDYRPQKEDPNRVRITAGGNLINYPYELTTRTADLTTSKVMWNSVISTPGARYACVDVKNFYLCTPLDRYEYMRIPVSVIPPEFMDLYNLHDKVKGGYIYMEIQMGMYGLPQSGILANKLLKERLAEHGYFELPHTPGLFMHKTRPVWFTLVVDDFGIKYVGRQHAEHLIGVLKEFYEVEVDWEGSLYCGITLDWHYEDRYVDISMPKYVHKQLLRYAHSPPRRKQYCPYEPNPIRYGKQSDDIEPEEDSPEIDDDGKKFVQQVVGSFLYYARAVDLTILHALSEIASQQANPTEKTIQRVNQLLDYMHSNPSAVIRFYASDMVLNVHSDASYLTAAKGRSRAGGYFFLGSLPRDNQPIKLNGNIAITCAILKLVAASAAEAELGALFLNTQEAKVIRLILEELGHPQPQTPVHIDNSTAVGIVNSTIKRQRSRSMEMRYFWLLDQEAQKMFKFLYQPGAENLADYPSKAHTGASHQHVRPYYLHQDNSPRELPRASKPSVRRGCAEILGDPYDKKVPLPRIPNSRPLGSRHNTHMGQYCHTANTALGQFCLSDYGTDR